MLVDKLKWVQKLVENIFTWLYTLLKTGDFNVLKKYGQKPI